MQIRDMKNFIAGLILLAFGAAALWISSGYKMGTAFRMGPGYFPIVLSVLLIAVGLVIVVIALKSKESSSPGIAWRPLVIVGAAVVLFGLAIDHAGLLLTTFLMAIASRFARPGYSAKETVLLGAALAVLCALVFYFGLRVQMPLLPKWPV